MKIIKLSDLSGNGVPRVEILCDSALQKTGKPFFVPDFADRFTYRVAVAVHICRLGKNISAKFANRYYDESGLAFLIEAEDLYAKLQAENRPVSVADSFDGSVILGDVSSKYISDDICFDLRIDGRVEYHADLRSIFTKLDSYIEYISKYFTLKIGDYILLDYDNCRNELKIGTNVAAFINGDKSIDIKFK